ncbi:MAG: phosphoribosylglycinamide formyltransferase [Planctomycetota bacterium]|nr:phosphoribosylglycinamide formyltransferase [Planctomycetota bacterium]
MARKKLRLGVLLSGGGRTFQNILDRAASGRLDVKPVVVVASRVCRGLDLARQAGVPAHLVVKKDFPDVESYSAPITAIFDAAGVDLVVMAGFLSFWRIPEQYAGRVVNIHPALLPSFGGHGMFGHHVHEAALAAGVKVSGCTVHFVTNEYDVGPIIVQKAVPVLEGDTADSLAARVFEQECEAMPEALQLLAEGRVHVEGRATRIAPRPRRSTPRSQPRG